MKSVANNLLFTHKQCGLNGPMNDIEQMCVGADPTPKGNKDSRKKTSIVDHLPMTFTSTGTKTKA